LADSWFRYEEDRDVLILVLRVQPNASRTGFAGFHHGYPKVRVAAPAIEDRAMRCSLIFLRKNLICGVGRLSLRVAAAGVPRPSRSPTRGGSCWFDWKNSCN